MCLCVCVLGKIGSQRLDYYISDLKYMFELKEGRDTHIRAHSHTHTSPPPPAVLLFPTG